MLFRFGFAVCFERAVRPLLVCLTAGCVAIAAAIPLSVTAETSPPVDPDDLTYLPVGQSCAPGDTSLGNTTNDIFCFEGAGGDSTWPAMPLSEGFTHWSRKDPPSYDGWHLEFDPNYRNKGNTCFFSDDWMWAAKPAGGPIPENGFDFILVTPAFDVTGWTAGIITYDHYYCTRFGRDDQAYEAVRSYSSPGGWSAWEETPFLGEGCGNFPQQLTNITPHLTSAPDSLQFGWGLRDLSDPLDPSWGSHGAVQHVVDNVAIASYIPTSTLLVGVQPFRDTFSRSDPAHTDLLINDEEGQWPSRPFDNGETFRIELMDPDGIPPGNVSFFYRSYPDFFRPFSPWPLIWESKAATYSGAPAGVEGVWEVTLGNDADEDWAGDPGDGLIWEAGTNVEYYVVAVDANGDSFVWPNENPVEEVAQFSVLPFFHTLPAQGDITVLMVHESSGPSLDVHRSGGFSPTGGAGFGSYDDPVFIEEGDYMEQVVWSAPFRYDRYDVTSANDPRANPIPSSGVGGFLDENGDSRYDVIIWTHGRGPVGAPFEAETIPALMTHLDAGKKMLVMSDRLPRWLLGSTAEDFGRNYLGVEPSTSEFLTFAGLIKGLPGSSFEDEELFTFGECPQRKHFSILTPSVPVAGTVEPLLELHSGPVGLIGLRTLLLSGGVSAVIPSVSTQESRRLAWCLWGRTMRRSLDLPVGGITCDPPPTSVSGVSPTSLGLSPPRPTPFQGTTTLQFSLPAEQSVRVSIYDVSGRRLVDLVDGRLSAGPHEAVWDGRSSAGQQVAAGVYFVRLETAGRSLTQKVVRVE